MLCKELSVEEKKTIDNLSRGYYFRNPNEEVEFVTKEGKYKISELAEELEKYRQN